MEGDWFVKFNQVHKLVTKTICLLFLPPLITVLVASLDSRFTTSCTKTKYKAPITQHRYLVRCYEWHPVPPDTPKTQFKVRLQQPGGHCSGQGGHRPLCRGVRDCRWITLVLERRLASYCVTWRHVRAAPAWPCIPPVCQWSPPPGLLIIGWNEWREWHLRAPGPWVSFVVSFWW